MITKGHDFSTFMVDLTGEKVHAKENKFLFIRQNL